MYPFIQQFFSQTGYLTLNGLGTFRLQHMPPVYQTVQKKFVAPKDIILYSREDEQTTESFVAYVAKQIGIPLHLAKARIEKNNSLLIQELKEKGLLDFGWMGTLQKKDDGTIDFISKSFFEDIPLLPAEKVIRKNEAHTITVGESEKTNIEMEALLHELPSRKTGKWWIAALVIGLASIAYLLYYYFTNNSF